MDRNNEIFSKYDFKVKNISRTRGGYLLDTDLGLNIIKKVDMNLNRLMFENAIKEHLYNLGNEMIDIFIKNINDEIISCDKDDNKYIIKRWFPFNTCELNNIYHVKMTAQNLASLHNKLINIEAEVDNEEIFIKDNLSLQFEKRNKELRRVRRYIKNKKQKNKFETMYYKNYENFYEKSKYAEKLLIDFPYDDMYKTALNNKCICHGNYVYHNILIKEVNLKAANLDDNSALIATTNFERAYYGIQITDLYYFLRKVMEKSDWDIMIGEHLLDAYNNVKRISKNEYKLLYVLLSYPEKFWKITNSYYNNKKSWISNINIKKLELICSQEKEKQIFLKTLEKYF